MTLKEQIKHVLMGCYIRNQNTPKEEVCFGMPEDMADARADAMLVMVHLHIGGNILPLADIEKFLGRCVDDGK